METALATLFVMGIAIGLDNPAPSALPACEFVNAKNGNYLFAANPECYAADPIGAESPEK
jgi:hypothetical protein